ncbi:MAG: sodium/proton-translocating pyrophosphatase, partial [Clostridia bacterium]|nr:sodium/proton-translocating pyrophosphatase [Clostridia bacterium]
MLSFLFDYAEPSVLVLCGLSIVLACLLIWGIKRVRVENDRMNEIASYIKNGAMAYLYRQYRTLALFLVVMFCALALLPGLGFDLAGAFLFGAMLSVLAGYLGMRTAVISNVRTAAEARKGISAAFRVAFSGGAVMGIFVVGLGAFGIALLSLITDNTNVLTGFSLGASSIALFCRVGGGIYTKAAD